MINMAMHGILLGYLMGFWFLVTVEFSHKWQKKPQVTDTFSSMILRQTPVSVQNLGISGTQLPLYIAQRAHLLHG